MKENSYQIRFGLQKYNTSLSFSIKIKLKSFEYLGRKFFSKTFIQKIAEII